MDLVAAKVVADVLDGLFDRYGFEGWWLSLHPRTQRDIKVELVREVSATLKQTRRGEGEL